MGLGLSAVCDTMQARGESLWVTSKSRGDSTYKIYLPGIEAKGGKPLKEPEKRPRRRLRLERTLKAGGA